MESNFFFFLEGIGNGLFSKKTCLLLELRMFIRFGFVRRILIEKIRFPFLSIKFDKSWIEEIEIG